MTLANFQPQVPTPEIVQKPDLVRLERHIEDDHAEGENFTEVAKLIGILGAQSLATATLGFTGFIPTVAVVSPCLLCLHQSLTQLDNSCGINVENPKRFVSGVASFGITASHAGFSIWKGYELDNMRSRAIQEVREGEQVAKKQQPQSPINPYPLLIAAVAAVFMFKQLRKK